MLLLAYATTKVQALTSTTCCSSFNVSNMMITVRGPEWANGAYIPGPINSYQNSDNPDVYMFPFSVSNDEGI